MSLLADGKQLDQLCLAYARKHNLNPQVVRQQAVKLLSRQSTGKVRTTNHKWSAIGAPKRGVREMSNISTRDHVLDRSNSVRREKYEVLDKWGSKSD